MTFDDDYVRLLTPFGHKTIPLLQLGLQWPPPEEISVHGASFKRLRLSQITDDQRAELTRVARGAEYQLVQH